MLAPFRVSEADKQSESATAYHRSERRIGRIDRPPDRRAYARIPPDFGQRFLIFVDTEEEFDWTQPLARENTAVTAMEGLPEAQRFFRSAGAKPTYMVDYPIVDNRRSVDILRQMVADDGCEIGTQLHPWVNPPFEEEVTPYNSFTGNLPVELQKSKLRCLTEKIEDTMGRRPVLYRAGRYGIGSQSAALLEEAGYEMDASVRALFNYASTGGPDFSGFETDAFWAGPNRNLLELPLTATYVGHLRRLGGRLFPLGDRIGLWRSLLARSGMLQRVSLTPEDYPLDMALDAIRRMLDDGRNIFSLSYHSPSVVPGHTPYVRVAEDLRVFYRWWDGVFDLFARHGVEAARAGEVVAAARAAR